MIKVAELRTMKSKELGAEVERLRRHLFDLRSQAVTEKLENARQLQSTRQDIARALTVLNERGDAISD